jgi:hypothetical protein
MPARQCGSTVRRGKSWAARTATPRASSGFVAASRPRATLATGSADRSTVLRR